MRRASFRQRVAWLFLFVYLGLTIVCVYYVFEISSYYSLTIEEHTKAHHMDQEILRHFPDGKNIILSTSEERRYHTDISSQFHHIVDLPVSFVVIVCLTVYVQVFFSLWTCTRPDCRLTYACLWPVFLCAMCRCWYVRVFHTPVKSNLLNGYHAKDPEANSQHIIM